jgi:hypothetical protein
MLHSAKNRSLYDNRFHICNDYFVIDDRDPVLDFISHMNTQKGFKSVSTDDFSTLYTSIPHYQLKSNLEKFVKRVFEFKEKSYIVPNLFTKKGYFTSSLSNSKVQFSNDTLCIYFLIDNKHVTYRASV